MLKRHWRLFAEAVGLLIAIAIIGALALGKPELPKYQQHQEANAGYRPGGTNCQPTRLQRLTGGNAANERERCQEAAEEYRLKQEDLIQQTRAADAASVVVGLTYQQTIILLMGSVLSLMTLGAAIYAAWYAKRAAEAAEENLAHAKHTARAYITTDSEKITHSPEGRFSFVIIAKNAGNTPAQKLRFVARVEFRYNNGGVVAISKHTWNNGTTGPSTPVELTGGFALAPDEFRALKERKGSVAIELHGSYTNAFGEDWLYRHPLEVNAMSLINSRIYTEDCKQFRDEAVEEVASHEPTLPMGMGQ